MPTLEIESIELKNAESFQELVDAINSILCMDSEVEASLVTSAHEKLDAAVSGVNTRLKKCDSLLQKGLRAEALQESQIEPKLLDAVAILDFDELELWNNYAQQCGFSKVPELLLDIVDDLQTAWADEEPLTDLRYRHRLHALARSPLPIRIDILRRLAKVDQSNPLWEEEVVVFEKARMADLLEECKTAAANEDLEKIVALEAELKSDEWRASPSKKLVGFAETKSQEIQGKFALVELEAIEPRLNEAYSLSDVEAARKLREEWGRHVAVAQLSGEDPLMQKVMESLKWLAEKDRQDREQAEFEAAVAELEQALDRKDAVKADFEPLYYRIEQFGRGIPENLQQRLTDRVAELDQNAARKRRMKILTFTAAVVAVLIMIGVGIFLYVQSAEVDRHVANLQGLLDNDQLDDAETYISEREQDNPRVHGHKAFQAVARVVEQKVFEEKDRRTQFERDLGVAEDVKNSITADKPSTLARENINKGYDALTRANGVAKTEEETSAVLAMKDDLDKTVITVQAAVDDQFRAEVSRFQEQVQDLDPDATTYSDQLSNLRSLATGTLLKKPYISDGLAARVVDPVVDEIDTMISEDALAAAERSYLREIRKAIGDANSYRLKLNEYVDDDKFKGTARQRDFEQVVKNETSLWVGFEAWSELKADLRDLNLLTYNPKYAPTLLAKVDTVLKQHKGFPDEPELQEIANYLRVLVQRTEGGLLSELERNVLNQQIVLGLSMLEIKNDDSDRKYKKGEKYYSTKPPTPLGKTHYTIRYAEDTTLASQKALTVKREDVANPLENGDHNFDSPQMKFAKFAKAKMVTLSADHTKWEEEFLAILESLHADKKMDPFLKFLLISSVESTACQGSLYLSQVFQKNLEALQKAGTDLDPDANWIDPKASDGPAARLNATGVIVKLTTPQDAKKGLEAYQTKMKRIRVGPEYGWVGWLHRDRKNQWTVSYSGATPSDAEAKKLYVLTRAGSSGPVTFTPIGELKFGEIKITSPDGVPALVQGRPVYSQK